MRRPQPRSVEALCRDARRVAVLEGIVDSTNIGAIFRGAAALGMDAVLLSPSCCDPALRAEPRLAIVLGTEGDGLARTTIAHCDYTVMIPMQHGVDSLNVAAAGAVAFWELRAR